MIIFKGLDARQRDVASVLLPPLFKVALGGMDLVGHPSQGHFTETTASEV